MDVAPGPLDALDMLEDHARDHHVVAAILLRDAGEVAGDVETGGAEPGRGEGEFAGVDIVDDEFDAAFRGLFGGEERRAPASDLADAAQAVLPREREDGRFVMLPGPVRMPMRRKRR